MLAMIYALVGVIVISILPLGFLPVYDNGNVKKFTAPLLALAIGCLIGDACFHLLPEMLGIPLASPLVAMAVGIFCFFWGEQYLQLYHCGHVHQQDQHEHENNHVGALVIFSEFVHNIIDGLAIGVSFRSSLKIGVTTSIAIFLHEVPHELGDFAILLNSEYSKRQIVEYHLMASAGALLGAMVGGTVGRVTIKSVQLQPLLLGLTAGNFLYIALADLIPELLHSKHNRFIQHGLVGIGAGSMLMLKWFLN